MTVVSMSLTYVYYQSDVYTTTGAWAIWLAPLAWSLAVVYRLLNERYALQRPRVVGLVALFGGLDLGAEKPDIADVMLGAGIWAASKMDIERAIDLHPAFAPLRDRFGVPLGI